MSELNPQHFLPDFALEHAPGEHERAELVELFAKLSALAPKAANPADWVRGRSRLLAAVSVGSERWAPLFGKLTAFFELSADALRAQLQRAGDESEWEQGPLPWVSLFHLSGGPALAAFDVGLVRIKKGMPFPPHRHQGSERVLILDGGYHDDAQRFWGPGDLHVMTEGTEHSLQMNADRDVLMAVILTDEIRVIGAP
jgi:quercetin dioxygenase-like cupin family protein